MSTVYSYAHILLGEAVPKVVRHHIYIHFLTLFFIDTAKRRNMVQSNQTEGSVSGSSKVAYYLVAIGICTVNGQLPNACNELLLTYKKEHQKELLKKFSSTQFSAYTATVEVRISLDRCYMLYTEGNFQFNPCKQKNFNLSIPQKTFNVNFTCIIMQRI